MDQKEQIVTAYTNQKYSACLTLLKAAPYDITSSTDMRILQASCLINISGRTSEAHQILDKILQQEPTNGLAFYGKGLAFLKESNLEKSFENFTKAAELDKTGVISKAQVMKLRTEEMLKSRRISERLSRRKSAAKSEIICEICNKTFAQLFSLNRHRLIHSGERPHKCQLCNFGFVQKSDLQRHMSVHNDTPNFSCESCEKKFKSKKNLNLHIQTHSMEKPFKCETCGKDFKYRRLVKLHQLVHSKRKKFSCDICEKIFVTKPSLKAHLAAHVDVMGTGNESGNNFGKKSKESDKNESNSKKLSEMDGNLKNYSLNGEEEPPQNGNLTNFQELSTKIQNTPKDMSKIRRSRRSIDSIKSKAKKKNADISLNAETASIIGNGAAAEVENDLAASQKEVTNISENSIILAQNSQNSNLKSQQQTENYSASSKNPDNTMKRITRKRKNLEIEAENNQANQKFKAQDGSPSVAQKLQNVENVLKSLKKTDLKISSLSKNAENPPNLKSFAQNWSELGKISSKWMQKLDEKNSQKNLASLVKTSPSSTQNAANPSLTPLPSTKTSATLCPPKISLGNLELPPSLQIHPIQTASSKLSQNFNTSNIDPRISSILKNPQISVAVTGPSVPQWTITTNPTISEVNAETGLAILHQEIKMEPSESAEADGENSLSHDSMFSGENENQHDWNLFFKSLMHDLTKMDDRQRRKFKQQTFTLIDDILQ